MVERKVDSLASLGEEYMVVVNCSGLGARYLCGDKSVLPLRGQVKIKTQVQGSDNIPDIVPNIERERIAKGEISEEKEKK